MSVRIREPAFRLSRTADSFAVGGFLWSANYADSYAIAAERLIASSANSNDLDTVGLPICFLQRHATELALKNLLAMVYSIDFYWKWIEWSRSAPGAAEPVEQVVQNTHDLKKLLAILREALHATNLGELHQDFEKLVDALCAVEGEEHFAHTRFRYPTVGQGADRDRAFTVRAVIPVGENQVLLERVFNSHLDFEFEKESDASDQSNGTANPIFHRPAHPDTLPPGGVRWKQVW